jgi:hypothetical protein
MRCALFLLALICGARAFAADNPSFLEPHFVEVDISRSGNDWIAEYTFSRPVEAWFFPRSSVTRKGEEPWRLQSWVIETAGVRLVRRGDYDVLIPPRGGMPRKVRMRFQPFTADLADDYSPALSFTDGGIALFSAQFDVLPLRSVGEAGELPSDLNNSLFAETHLKMRFHDGARVVEHDGEFATYALFGPTRIVETRDVITVFDPQLPAWIHQSLARSVTELLARYSTQLGPLPEGRPTVMVAWGGPTPGIVGRIGGALRGQIVMKYEGSGMINETPQQRAEGMWFVAHEAAHFWLGQTVAYDYAREAWITEGGADLLAVRAIAALDSSYDWRAELDRAIGDCVDLSRRRGVAEARERNEHRAYYACGVVFGLVAEAASRTPFHVFVRRLIDENRADGIVTRADWLRTLDTVSRDATLSRDIARLLDRGSPEPAEFITSLFERAGVAFRPDQQKIPRMK